MSGGGIPCTFCEGQRAAAVLMTWLANGATVNTCTECFAPATINVLALDLGVDPTRFYAAIERFMAAEAKRQQKEAEKGTPDAAAGEPAAGQGEPTPDDEDQADVYQAGRDQTVTVRGSGDEAP